MSEHIVTQQQFMHSIDRALDNFKKIGVKNYTPAKIRSRINALKDVWAQFQNGHTLLVKSISAPTKQSMEYFQENQYDNYEDTYQRTLHYMCECLEELEPPVSPNQSFDHGHPLPCTSTALSLSHLPPINLPPFDGKYEQWESFRDRFTALIINNKELSDFSRMHFLTSCLKDRALECIGNIQITADNFNVAWSALVSRYENKRRLINVHLSSLFNLTVATRDSANELQLLRDKSNIAVAALKNLKRSPAELWNDILVYIVTQKLDPVTRKAWNLKASDSDDPPSYDELNKFLASRTRALEECKQANSAMAKTNVKPAHAQKVSSSNAAVSSPSSCSLCKAKHYIHVCPKFASKNPAQRREFVNQTKRCFNCLSQSHAVQACRSKYTCRICQKKHHTMLHADSDSCSKAESQTSSTPPPVQPVDTKQDVTSLFVTSHARTRTHVLLATAWVTVGVSTGRSLSVRALLDQGSEMTFMSENLAQRLKAKRLKMPITISAVGCVDAGTHRFAAQIQIFPRDKSSPSFSTTALILKELTAYAPKRVPVDTNLSHLADLSWADQDPLSAHPIELIIGADIYGDLILDGVRKGSTGQPIAQNSVLGWVISGPVSSSSGSSLSPDKPSLMRATTHHCFQAPSLETEIRRFWEIEEVPRYPVHNLQDDKCEEHFRLTHTRCPDGRYMVRLPFKEGPPINIGDSRHRAERLLNSLDRRLKECPTQEANYSEFLREYEQLGHMRKAPALPRNPDQCVYIPHHSVIRKTSVTTQLRVVFNASSVTTNGSSLNDHLLVGPKLQTELPAVILQWRPHKYVYTADIVKMYRQIRVDPRDVDYQRILWRTVSSESPSEYQLLTVTYGTACAPFLALRVLKQLVHDEGHQFPIAVPILREQIYVDDVLFGADDLDHLKQARNQLCSLLQLGGFELRKWASNSPALLVDIDPANHGLACNKSLQANEQVKILGISWNPALDIPISS